MTIGRGKQQGGQVMRASGAESSGGGVTCSLTASPVIGTQHGLSTRHSTSAMARKRCTQRELRRWHR